MPIPYDDVEFFDHRAAPAGHTARDMALVGRVEDLESGGVTSVDLSAIQDQLDAQAAVDVAQAAVDAANEAVDDAQTAALADKEDAGLAATLDAALQTQITANADLNTAQQAAITANIAAIAALQVSIVKPDYEAAESDAAGILNKKPFDLYVGDINPATGSLPAANKGNYFIALDNGEIDGLVVVKDKAYRCDVNDSVAGDSANWSRSDQHDKTILLDAAEIAYSFKENKYWLAPTDAKNVWPNRGTLGGVVEVGSAIATQGAYYFDPVDTAGSNSYVTIADNPFDFTATGEGFIAVAFRFNAVTLSSANPRIVRSITGNQGFECYVRSDGDLQLIVGNGTTLSFVLAGGLVIGTDYVFMLHFKAQMIRVQVSDAHGVSIVDELVDTSARDDITPATELTIFGGPSGKWIEGELGDILIGTSPPEFNQQFIDAMKMRAEGSSQKRRIVEAAYLGKMYGDRIDVGQILEKDIRDGDDITDAINEAVEWAGDRKSEVYIPSTYGFGIVNSEIDLKRCNVKGFGTSHDGQDGGTQIRFASGGFVSSIPSNWGFSVENMTIKGAGVAVDATGAEIGEGLLAGQVLIDCRGQNAPRLNNLKLGEVGGGTWDQALENGDGAWIDPGVCLLFDAHDTSTVETHYSNFNDIFMEKMDIGAYFPDSGVTGGHKFTGGRIWRANKNGIGFEIGDGVGNIKLDSVYLETGSTTWNIIAAVRSKSSSLTIDSPRSEISVVSGGTAPGLWIRNGAGTHTVIGGAWSGRHIKEDNNPDDNVFIGNFKRNIDSLYATETLQNALYGSLPNVRKLNFLHNTSTQKSMALDANGGVMFDDDLLALAKDYLASPVYADQATAATGGVVAGSLFRTSDGQLFVKT